MHNNHTDLARAPQPVHQSKQLPQPKSCSPGPSPTSPWPRAASQVRPGGPVWFESEPHRSQD
eukprot:7669729-Pyramimonas_sp.AAC.1